MYTYLHIYTYIYTYIYIYMYIYIYTYINISIYVYTYIYIYMYPLFLLEALRNMFSSLPLVLRYRASFSHPPSAFSLIWRTIYRRTRHTRCESLRAERYTRARHTHKATLMTQLGQIVKQGTSEKKMVQCFWP